MVLELEQCSLSASRRLSQGERQSVSRPQLGQESLPACHCHSIPCVMAADQPPALKLHQFVSLTPLLLGQDLKHFHSARKQGLFRACVHSLDRRSGKSPGGRQRGCLTWKGEMEHKEIKYKAGSGQPQSYEVGGGIQTSVVKEGFVEVVPFPQPLHACGLWPVGKRQESIMVKLLLRRPALASKLEGGQVVGG